MFAKQTRDPTLNMHLKEKCKEKKIIFRTVCSVPVWGEWVFLNVRLASFLTCWHYRFVFYFREKWEALVVSTLCSSEGLNTCRPRCATSVCLGLMSRHGLGEQFL